jgi:phytoene dehydrogenase-like protein
VILARAGRRVVVLEKGRVPGGRASTQLRQKFLFNLGAHALYRAGRAAAILRDLGVPWHGTEPDGDGALAGGRIHRLPRSAWSLLATTLLPLREKFEAARLMSHLPGIATAPLDSIPVRTWLDREVRGPRVRQLLEGVFRVSTYCADFDRLSAGAALQQMKLAFGGVWYLDGGWGTLVDGLRTRLAMYGGELRCGISATLVEPRPGGFLVHRHDCLPLEARHVVIAASPADAARLVPAAEPAFLARLNAARPVVVATLDLALARLPDPRRTFVLGIDKPLYLSVHSRWASLAPAGGALVHVMKYLTEPLADAASIRHELKDLVDLSQPGWRDFVVDERFAPHLVATHQIATAERGGLAGRPDIACPGLPGVYFAGDWVGAEGMLADAALASAQRAAQAILEPPHDLHLFPEAQERARNSAVTVAAGTY